MIENLKARSFIIKKIKKHYVQKPLASIFGRALHIYMFKL